MHKQAVQRGHICFGVKGKGKSVNGVWGWRYTMYGGCCPVDWICTDISLPGRLLHTRKQSVAYIFYAAELPVLLTSRRRRVSKALIFSDTKDPSRGLEGGHHNRDAFYICLSAYTLP